MNKSNDVLITIKTLCTKNDITLYKLARGTGIPQSTLYGLFETNSYPSIPQIRQICDYFCITLGDFFSLTINFPSFSEADYLLYNRIHHLPLSKKKMVTTYLDVLETE